MKTLISLCFAFCSLTAVHSLPFISSGDLIYPQNDYSPTNRAAFEENLDLGEVQDILEHEIYSPLVNVLEEGEEELSPQNVLIREKRQARDMALNLALDHDRPVGRPHGRIDLSGSGQDSRNYHVQGGAGVGGVLWRSQNDRHSLGAGAYVSQGTGRYFGQSYRTQPDTGVGLGYRFRF